MPIGDWALRSDEQSQRSILAQGEYAKQGMEALGQGISGAASMGMQSYVQARQLQQRQQQMDYQHQLELEKFQMEKGELQWKMGVTAQQQQMQGADLGLRQAEFQHQREVYEWNKKLQGEQRDMAVASFQSDHAYDTIPDSESPGKFFTWVSGPGGEMVKHKLTDEEAKQRQQLKEQWLRQRYGGSSSGYDRMPQADVEAFKSLSNELSKLNDPLNEGNPAIEARKKEIKAQLNRINPKYPGQQQTQEPQQASSQSGGGFFSNAQEAAGQFTDLEEGIIKTMSTPTVAPLMQHADAGPMFSALLHNDVQTLISAGQEPQAATQYVAALLKSPEGVADYLARMGYQEDQIETYLSISFPRMEMDAMDVAKIAYGRHNEKAKESPEDQWQRLDMLKNAGKQNWRDIDFSKEKGK